MQKWTRSINDQFSPGENEVIMLIAKRLHLTNMLKHGNLSAFRVSFIGVRL